MEQFHLSYIMQRDDFVALARVVSRRTPQRILFEALLLGVLIVGAYFIGAGGSALTLPSYPAEFSAAIGVGLAVLLGTLFPLRWLQLWLMAGAAYRRNAAAGKTVTFDIDEHTIVGGIAGVTTTLQWSAVTRLIETPERLFVAISRREALILPRRAFADATTCDQFIAFARSLIGQSPTESSVGNPFPSGEKAG
jgi:hypothetical protein